MQFIKGNTRLTQSMFSLKVVGSIPDVSPFVLNEELEKLPVIRI